MSESGISVPALPPRPSRPLSRKNSAELKYNEANLNDLSNQQKLIAAELLELKQHNDNNHNNNIIVHSSEQQHIFNNNINDNSNNIKVITIQPNINNINQNNNHVPIPSSTAVTSSGPSSSAIAISAVPKSSGSEVSISVELDPKENDSIQHDTITRAVHFDHHTPLLSSRLEYFLTEALDRTQYDGVLTVLISAFNEAASELQATLNDIFIQHQVLINSGIRLDIHVCLILDGWMKTSNSMRLYMKNCYPVDNHTQTTNVANNNSTDNQKNLNNNNQNSNNPENNKQSISQLAIDSDNPNIVPNWQEYVEQWEFESEAGGDTADVVDTLILQRRVNNKDLTIGKVSVPASFARANKSSIIPSVKLTTIIKRDNRRKHNSHEWFLCGFAPVYTSPFDANPYSTANPTSKSQYNCNAEQLMLLTDCGTRFNKGCLLMLVEYCLANPEVVACSGRNRIMSYKQQATGENEAEFEQNIVEESESYLEAAYRAAQGFDYEASVNSYSPAFSSIGGMLPVIPGPCGLFRLDLLVDQSQATHQSRLNEEIIQLTCVSITDHQVKQSKTMKEFHSNAVKYVNHKLEAIQQTKDWSNIEQQLLAGMNNNNNNNNNNNINQEMMQQINNLYHQSKLASNTSNNSSHHHRHRHHHHHHNNNNKVVNVISPTDKTINNTLSRNSSYSSNTSPNVKDSTTDTSISHNTNVSSPVITNNIKDPNHANNNPNNGGEILIKQFPSLNKQDSNALSLFHSGELEQGISGLLNSILSTQMKFEESSKLLRVYLRYLLERDDILHNITKTDESFMQQLGNLIVRLTTEFESIGEQLNLLEIVMNQIKYKGKADYSVSSQLFIRCAELLPMQEAQLVSLEVFRNLLISLLCGTSPQMREGIENQMLYRLNAPYHVINAIEQKSLNNEMRNARDSIEFYIRIVNKNPYEAGILLGSLLLAEDRILSYSAVLKSVCPYPVRTAFVSDAIFHCQAETTAESLCVQRRRWINGTVAGYIWLMKMRWNNMFINRTTKRNMGSMFMYLLFMMQLLQYVAVLIVPSLYVMTLRYALTYFLKITDPVPIYLYFAFYTGFVYIHTTDTQTKLHRWLYSAIGIANTGVLGLGIYTLVIIGTNNELSYCLAQKSFSNAFTCFSLITLIVTFVTLPFIITLVTDIVHFLPAVLFHNRRNKNLSNLNELQVDGQYCSRCSNKSGGFHLHCINWPTLTNFYNLSAFVRMIRFSLGYYLLLPTLTMLLPSYAFCRTWELTWGNRPSANMTISNKSTQELERIKKEIFTTSHVISGLIWACNLVLTLAILEAPGSQNTDYDSVMLYTAYIFLGLPLLHMMITALSLLITMLLIPFKLFITTCRLTCCAHRHHKPKHNNTNTLNNNNDNGLLVKDNKQSSIDNQNPDNKAIDAITTGTTTTNKNNNPAQQIKEDKANKDKHLKRPSELFTADLDSPLEIDDLVSSLPHSGVPNFHPSGSKGKKWNTSSPLSQLKFDYNTASFRLANYNATDTSKKQANMASPNAKFQLFRQKNSYVSPNMQIHSANSHNNNNMNSKLFVA